jgi:hypothetical protein
MTAATGSKHATPWPTDDDVERLFALGDDQPRDQPVPIWFSIWDRDDVPSEPEYRSAVEVLKREKCRFVFFRSKGVILTDTGMLQQMKGDGLDRVLLSKGFEKGLRRLSRKGVPMVVVD